MRTKQCEIHLGRKILHPLSSPCMQHGCMSSTEVTVRCITSSLPARRYHTCKLQRARLHLPQGHNSPSGWFMWSSWLFVFFFWKSSSSSVWCRRISGFTSFKVQALFWLGGSSNHSVNDGEGKKGSQVTFAWDATRSRTSLSGGASGADWVTVLLLSPGLPLMP